VNIPEVDLCKRPNDLRAVRPQDYDLTGCGVPDIPSSTRYVDLYKVYVYSVLLAAVDDVDGGDILPDEKKQVDCDCDFLLHKITPLSPNGALANAYYARFQWANGRFSSNQLQNIQTFNGVCYTQDGNRNTIPMRYPAGSFIGISLQNFFAEAIPVTILFEGVSRFYLCRKGGR
jgi:hypothetical protein